MADAKLLQSGGELIIILVTYISLTGNTKRVADAIFGGIEGKKEIKPMDQVKSLEGYDLSLIGFPIYTAEVPARAEEFMEKNAKGKKGAFFFTHASPVDPKMPETIELRNAISNNVRVAGAGTNPIESFDAQRQVADDLVKMCVNSPTPNCRCLRS